MPVAGRSLEELPKEQWPCCIDERAAFMAPFEMEVVKRHALAAATPNTTATSSLLRNVIRLIQLASCPSCG